MFKILGDAQYIGWCSAHLVDVMCTSMGYLEYIRDVQYTIHMGDIPSTLGSFSASPEYSEYIGGLGGYQEYTGGG